MNEATISVLVKGMNFAIAPHTLPVKDIACSTELAIKDLPLSEAEEIRREVSRILKTAKPPKRNITREEGDATTG